MMYMFLHADWRAFGNGKEFLSERAYGRIIERAGFRKVPEMDHGGMGKIIYAVQIFLSKYNIKKI